MSDYDKHPCCRQTKNIVDFQLQKCYIIEKEQPPTKWLTSSSLKAYLHRASDKVGLFIFACCSYLNRQAMQWGTFRRELTMLKPRMYSYTPPPFFCQSMGGYHLVTRSLHLRIISYLLLFGNLLFPFLNFQSVREKYAGAYVLICGQLKLNLEPVGK